MASDVRAAFSNPRIKCAPSNQISFRTSIDVRNPYVDPINIVQIALLARLRGDPSVSQELWQAFLVTVNGVAAGMRNVG